MFSNTIYNLKLSIYRQNINFILCLQFFFIFLYNFTFQIRHNSPQFYIYKIIKKNDIYVQQTNNNSDRKYLRQEADAIFLGIAGHLHGSRKWCRSLKRVPR